MRLTLDCAHPAHILLRDWAHPAHILLRDWAHPAHFLHWDLDSPSTAFVLAQPSPAAYMAAGWLQ